MKGTRENLERAAAIYLASSRTPLRVMDFPPFRRMLQVAFNCGRNLNQLELCHRDKLLTEVIEGERGLLEEVLDTWGKKHKGPSETNGAWLICDGATDVNGVSQEVIMLGTTSGSSLLFAANPHAESKTGEYLSELLHGVLTGEVDYLRMSAGSVDPASPLAQHDDEILDEALDDDHDQVDEATGRKRRKRRDPGAMLKTNHELCRNVFACGSDNATTPVKAMCMLEERDGIVPFGDVSHAINRTYMHCLEVTELKGLVEDIQSVINLFDSYTLPRQMLREATKLERKGVDGVERVVESTGKGVVRIIDTRFLSLATAAVRLNDVHLPMCEVIAKVSFQTWAAKQRADVRSKVERVRTILNSNEFWLRIDFLIKFSLGFIVAVRLFDGARPGCGCLVVKAWNMLANSVAQVLYDDKFASIISEGFFATVKNIIQKGWKKFHYPVYSAAYLGCIYFRDDIRKMRLENYEYFDELRSQMNVTFETMARRFDDQFKLRDEILPPNHESVVRLVDQLQSDFDAYIEGVGVFSRIASMGTFDLAPYAWWTNRGPASKLRTFMMRICALSPSSTPVERAHKLFKSIRTKQRNRLTYCRGFTLAMIAAEQLPAATELPFDWSYLKHYNKRVDALSDIDRDFLQSLVEDISESAISSEVEDEGLGPTPAMNILTVAAMGNGYSRVETVLEADESEIEALEMAPGMERLQGYREAIVPQHVFERK